MNLYTISNKLLFLLDKVETGELNEDDQKLLSELNLNRNTKLENYAKVIRSLEADVEAYKKEQTDLKKKQNQAERNIQWLKQEALMDLEKHSQKKIKTGIFTWTKVNLKPRLKVIDESKIPSEFKETYTEERVLKHELQQEFSETGEIIPGTELSVKTSIRLK